MRTISYKDPTGETAVGNILREERRRERQRLRAANRDSSEDTEKERKKEGREDTQLLLSVSSSCFLCCFY